MNPRDPDAAPPEPTEPPPVAQYVPDLAPDPPPPPEGRRAQLILMLMALATLLAGWVLWGQLGRDRDVERGKEHMAKQRHTQALGYFLKSWERKSLFFRPELGYLIGASYERLNQCGRANDFFMLVMKESQGTAWENKAKEGFRHCLDRINSVGAGPRGDTPLLVARKRRSERYHALILEIQANGPGVSAKLEAAYREYKAAHEAYVKAIEDAFEKLDRGGR